MTGLRKAITVVGVLMLGIMAIATTIGSNGVGASPPIVAVGSLNNQQGSGITALSVTPQGVGDLYVLAVKVSSASVTVSSVTGGGVSAWTRVAGPFATYNSHELELWMGTISNTGPATIAVGFSGSVSSTYTGLAAQEFAAGGSATLWAKQAASGTSNNTSATVNFPSLTPTGPGALYFSYAAIQTSGAAGSTPGVSYVVTADQDDVAYDVNTSSTLAPTAPQSPAGLSGSVAVLITASTTPPAPPTVSAVSPTSGSSAGGTSVTITGTNLTGATAVRFGSANATGVTVNSATSITATSPAGAVGTVDVTVTTPGGTSPTGSVDQFTYTTPSRSFSAVGAIVSIDGNGLRSVPVNPAGAGDALVLMVHIVASTATVSSVSGGGATGWTRYQQFKDVPSWSGQPHDTEIWLGTVTTAGSSTINVSYSASVGSVDTDLAAQEFSSGLGPTTSWSKDTGAGQDNVSSSTNVLFPTMTPASSGELYFGYAWVQGTSSAGSTSGVSYDVTADGNLVCFDTSVSSALTPIGSQPDSLPSASMGVLITAS
jgi:hypothetical protein